MAIERTYYCDGPDCPCHASTAKRGSLPAGFLAVNGDGPAQHFCSWDCVLRFAAAKEPTDVIAVGSSTD